MGAGGNQTQGREATYLWVVVETSGDVHLQALLNEDLGKWSGVKELVTVNLIGLSDSKLVDFLSPARCHQKLDADSCTEGAMGPP